MFLLLREFTHCPFKFWNQLLNAEHCMILDMVLWDLLYNTMDLCVIVIEQINL